MTDSPSSNPSTPLAPSHKPRTVVLCHTLPDGSSHLDWMIEHPAPTEHRLITFRTPCRPDEIESHRCISRRLTDHRAHYLDYEGILTADRGSVERVATGSVLGLSRDR